MAHLFNSCVKITFQTVFNFIPCFRHDLAQMKLLRLVNNLFRSKVIKLNVHNIFLKSVVKIQGVTTNK